MGLAVRDQGNEAIRLVRAIDFDAAGWRPAATWILHRDLVRRRAITIGDAVCLPGGWKAGCNAQRIAPHAQAENSFHANPIHPARRPGIPGPASATHMLRMGIDVGGDDIRLYLVARGILRRERMVNRV